MSTKDCSAWGKSDKMYDLALVLVLGCPMIANLGSRGLGSGRLLSGSLHRSRRLHGRSFRGGRLLIGGSLLSNRRLHGSANLNLGSASMTDEFQSIETPL